jgi:hypothetical protein
VHKKSCGKIPQQKNILKTQAKSAKLFAHIKVLSSSHCHAKNAKSGTTNKESPKPLRVHHFSVFLAQFFAGKNQHDRTPFFILYQTKILVPDIGAFRLQY